MTTVEVAIRQQGPWLNGVAPLRLGLVAALFAYQSLEVSVSYGRLANSPVWILPATLVPALFAIAGFLFASRLAHGSIRGFLGRRFLRAWPVLACAVIVTALVIGPLATGASLSGYFSDPDLALYLLNLIAVPVDRLPEVFAANFVATVNDVLWATPFAVASVAILAVAALRPARATLIITLTLAVLAATALAVQLAGNDLPGALAVIRPALAGRGLTALACFLLGALAWQQRSWLPVSWLAAAAAAAAIAAAAVLGGRDWGDLAAFDTAIAVPLAYLAIVLAVAPLPLIEPAAAAQKFLGGFVLFAYPVQQLVVASGLVGDSFIAVLVASLPATALLAVLAWHLVQRRFYILSGGGDGDVAAGDTVRAFNFAASWARGRELVPDFALWLAFLMIALAMMAMTIFAFMPESGGI